MIGGADEKWEREKWEQDQRERAHMTPYQPMNADELAELSREAGRELTEHEAMEYLKRRVHRAAVDNMLDGGSHD